eukprot:TRINITY_DN4632_c0_g1_i12.p1 TRINITY_DN4632_c0_g1~~TRINITY_DN4632_c0_g1_i12.p1  ORF type:complete len:219 (+),score=24.45 TRINITY_DN4632_c0_g1_i12:1456-2112(+)
MSIVTDTKCLLYTDSMTFSASDQNILSLNNSQSCHFSHLFSFIPLHPFKTHPFSSPFPHHRISLFCLRLYLARALLPLGLSWVPVRRDSKNAPLVLDMKLNWTASSDLSKVEYTFHRLLGVLSGAVTCVGKGAVIEVTILIWMTAVEMVGGMGLDEGGKIVRGIDRRSEIDVKGTVVIRSGHEHFTSGSVSSDYLGCVIRKMRRAETEHGRGKGGEKG